MKTVGERIRQARLALGLSANTLAKRVGYRTQSGISNLENGNSGNGGSKIGKIAQELGVSIDWLINGPDCDNVPFLPKKIDPRDLLVGLAKNISDEHLQTAIRLLDALAEPTTGTATVENKATGTYGR